MTIDPPPTTPPTKNPGRIKLLASGRIILLGVIHIDKFGPEEVRELIRREGLDLVCLELDEDRYRLLELREQARKTGAASPGEEASGNNPVSMDPRVLVDHGELSGVEEVFLQIEAIQEQLATQGGIDVGAEMWAAVEEARLQDCEVDLIDLPLQETIAQLGEFLPQFQAAMQDGIEDLNEGDIDEILESFRSGEKIADFTTKFAETFPEIANILLDKRNAYMASKILAHAREDYGKILVVVGAGHLDGLAKLIEADLSKAK